MSSRARPTSFEDVYELSPMQQGMLFHTLYDPAGDLYFEQCVVSVRGELDLDRFTRAWRRVATRHAILRTSFHWEGLEKPVQVVHAAVDLPIASADWRRLSPEEQRAGLDAFLREDRGRTFDLAVAPLLRVALFRIADDLFQCVLSFQHLLLDRWSRFLVLQEVFSIYAAESRGEEADLGPVHPYSEFISWLQGQDRAETENFWRRELAGFRVPTSLRLPEAAKPAEFHADARIRLSREASRRLESFARRSRLTIGTVVQGAWALLLSRYSGEEDVLFGSVVSGRPATLPGVETMVGLFINTLPLRVRVAEDEAVADWLRALQERFLRHRQYEHSSLLDVQGWSEIPRGTPLFESLIVFENVGGEADPIAGSGPLEVLGIRSVGSATNYPVTLFAHPGPQLSMSLLADARFERAAVDRLLGHLRVLLEAIASDSHARLADLPMLTDAERHRLLVEWNDTRREIPARRIHELFESQVGRTPDTIAATFEGDRLTYAELDRRANRLARHLARLGVERETRVAICLDRSLEMVVGLLAVLKAGGAYVPLDPAYPGERLDFMLEDAEPAVLLTEDRHAGRFAAFPGRIVRVDADRASIESEEPTSPAVAGRPEDLAYLIYTSGSTGRPKGVEIEHRSVANLLGAMQEKLRLGREDVLLAVTTLSFDIAALEIFLPLAAGARVAIAPRDNVADGALLLQELRRSGATLMQATPVSWRLLIDAGWQGGPIRALCGGEALPPNLADRIAERAAELWNLYGPTETTIWSTASLVARGERPVSIGRPLANTRVFVLDSRRRVVPEGVAGELYIGGAGVARGYRKRPQLTEEKFVADPGAEPAGARMYRTGDRVRWLSNGTLEYLGRIDQQVKLRGHRIELGEIEEVLKEDAVVRDAVAVIREDRPAEPLLVAYVLADGRAAQAADRGDGTLDDPVEQWRSVWDELYSQPEADPEFDLAGWRSSYTDERLAPEEMREWIDQTVERILSLSPRRVMEIGCGTGLVLHRVAPRTERYLATDVSPRGIERLRAGMARSGASLGQVELSGRAADDFRSVSERAFDTVVLNSVVQYFPSAEYLERVLLDAIRRLAEGGAVFIGDVRSLPLLEAFHASVALERARATLPLAEVARRAERGVRHEEELALDPLFFFELARRAGTIGRVEVSPKLGTRDNELNRYRYDVVMRVGPVAEFEPRSWEDWRERGLNAAELRRRLEDEKPEVLALRHVSNSRLARDLRALARLHAEDLEATAGDLRAELSRLPAEGADPGELGRWGRELGYRLEVSWADGSASGAFDAVFRRAGIPGSTDPIAFPTPERRHSERSLANNPRRASLARKLSPRLRARARERLPEVMVPSAFVFVDEWPLTPSGKVDRRALPPPDQSPGLSGRAFVPPSGDLEKELASIWSELLGVDRVSRRDNFFELGGHSLLATQLVSRVSEGLRVALPLREVFDRPTLAELAAWISESAPPGSEEEIRRALAEVQGLSDSQARERLASEEGNAP